VTYDNWKSTDPNVERAGAEEDALDAYEQKVWDYIVKLYKTQHGEEVPSDIMDDHACQMFDWMNDDKSPREVAELILEGEND
tara:strand:- start:113 stop:358 length:246 start_codon:yes stop_codon:yes gene_type:complete